MTLLWACGIRVLGSAVVALLPMRHHYGPGVALLLAAPARIIWVDLARAWWVTRLSLAAFISMYRTPLHSFWARACGMKPELPK